MSPLLNYTTKIDAARTIMEIQGILANHGARAILINYGTDGLIEAISFKVNTLYGELGFRLPIDPDAILKVLERQPLRTKVKLDHALGVRVAWRIVKDWIEAQMALLETDMVKLEQIFLPYLLIENDKTLYTKLVEGKFLLPEGKGEEV